MTQSLCERRSPVSRDALRYFAIICMTADHIAWFFLSFFSFESQLMHFFGRMTAPIMCFFIAEGYHYTKSLKKYFLRLGVFAVISQLPFYLLGMDELNMIFTLMLGLAAIVVIEEKRLHPALRVLAVAALAAAGHFADWSVFGVLWVVGFHVFRSSRAKKAAAFVVVWLCYLAYAVHLNLHSYGIEGVRDNVLYSLYTLGSLAALLLVLFVYNGKKGRFAFSRWVMYVYYPLHLMVIWIFTKL